MSRANVANGDAHAEPRRSFAFLKACLFLVSPKDVEPWLRHAVIATLAVFILVLTAASLIFASGDQDRAIADATTKLDLIASVISGDLNLRAARSPWARLSPVIPMAPRRDR